MSLAIPAADFPRRRWRKRILIGVLLLVLISPCALCAWTFVGYGLVFRSQLLVYPSAQEVANERSYEHANTEAERVYFWTPDSFDKVRAYYDQLTAPSAKPVSGLDDQQHPDYRTVFNPYGDAIPIITEEFGGETVDGAKDLACYFRIAWACVEVYVVDFGTHDPIDLRDFASASLGAIQATPEPLTIQGGRLIIYTYYVPGF